MKRYGRKRKYVFARHGFIDDGLVFFRIATIGNTYRRWKHRNVA